MSLNYFDYDKIRQISGKNYNNVEDNFYFIFVGGKQSNPFKEQKNVFKFSSHVKEAELKITKSIFNKQKKPYSDCDFIEDEYGNFVYPFSFDSKYYHKIKSAGYEYSQSMCISFCQLDNFGRNCSFGISSIKSPKNLNFICDDFVDSLTYTDYFENESVDKECAKWCPLECRTEQFELSLTRNEQRNMSDYGDDKILLNLFFDSVSYFDYEESPSISVYNLISNIGGAIGLLLGMSLLSIFEILEMVILSIYLIIRHKYRSFKMRKKLQIDSIV